MSLPPELRNRVYDLAIVELLPVPINEHLQAVYNMTPSGNLMLWTFNDPRLLNTCQQIYNEAAPVYYGRNTFTSTWSPRGTVLIWLRTIGKEKIAMLKRAQVHDQTQYHFTLVNSMLKMEGCETLFKKEGVPLSKDVFRVLTQVPGLGFVFFSRSEIEARMDDDDWVEHQRRARKLMQL